MATVGQPRSPEPGGQAGPREEGHRGHPAAAVAAMPPGAWPLVLKPRELMLAALGFLAQAGEQPAAHTWVRSLKGGVFRKPRCQASAIGMVWRFIFVLCIAALFVWW